MVPLLDFYLLQLANVYKFGFFVTQVDVCEPLQRGKTIIFNPPIQDLGEAHRLSSRSRMLIAHVAAEQHQHQHQRLQ